MNLLKNDNRFDLHKDLINKCLKNDKKAQLKLYNLYAKAMYNVSLNIVNNTQQAEDLMQEAFISAFKNLQHFRGEVTFGAWLKRIVVNKCLDYLKRKKVQFEPLEEQNLPSVELTENEESVFNHKNIQEIKEQINNLPDGYRTIISLYIFEGYDHEEIAQILNISPSTSRSQYVRAKSLLIKRLKENKD